jgi:hypothetical protein
MKTQCAEWTLTRQHYAAALAGQILANQILKSWPQPITAIAEEIRINGLMVLIGEKSVKACAVSEKFLLQRCNDALRTLAGSGKARRRQLRQGGDWRTTCWQKSNLLTKFN